MITLESTLLYGALGVAFGFLIGSVFERQMNDIKTESKE